MITARPTSPTMGASPRPASVKAVGGRGGMSGTSGGAGSPGRPGVAAVWTQTAAAEALLLMSRDNEKVRAWAGPCLNIRDLLLDHAVSPCCLTMP